MWQVARAKYTDTEAIAAIEDSGGIDIEGVNPVMCAVHATHQPTKDAKLGVVLGGANSYPGIWLGQATPDVTNYAFMGAGNATLFNAPAGGSFAFRIGNANKMKLHASGGFAIGDSFYATDPGTDDVSIEKDLSIRATTATRPLDINSNIIRLRSAYTPATAGSAGYQGDQCWDADYFYICVATNTWERTPHAWGSTKTIYLSSPFYGNGAPTAEGYALDPTTDEEVYFGLVLPSDWVSLVSLEVVWNIGLSDSPDPWVMNVGTYYGADGEVYFIHSDNDGANILGTPTTNFETTVTGTTGLLASATKNDYVRIKVERDANHASDLYDYDIKIMGVKIVYTSDM